MILNKSVIYSLEILSTNFAREHQAPLSPYTPPWNLAEILKTVVLLFMWLIGSLCFYWNYWCINNYWFQISFIHTHIYHRDPNVSSKLPVLVSCRPAIKDFIHQAEHGGMYAPISPVLRRLRLTLLHSETLSPKWNKNP